MSHASNMPRPLHRPSSHYRDNFGEEDTLRTLSLLCNFLRSQVTSSRLGPNILLSKFFKTPTICVLFKSERPGWTPIQNNIKN
jgi:hypothetical protein